MPQRGDVITNEQRASRVALCCISLKEKTPHGSSNTVTYHQFVQFVVFLELLCDENCDL